MDLEKMAPEVREEYQRFKRGMSPTHILIAEWIIQNPGGTYKEMGGFFGYSESWLCTLVHSDMFKAHLAGRIKDIQAVVTMDVPQKMQVLALKACERMQEVLETSVDKEQITDAFDKVMHRFGYAPNAKTGLHPQGPAIGQQNNVFYLSEEKFARVQGMLINAHAQQLPAPQPQPAKEDDRESIPSSVEALPTSR